MWDREGDLKKLIEFHQKGGHPIFFSLDGYCTYCSRDIVWPLVFDEERIGKKKFEPITGCPRCGHTYCD
jgi:hypothetical protein